MDGTKVPLTLADAGNLTASHVTGLHRRGQQAVMPARARPTDHPYHKDQFAYDEETDSYTCPHEQALSYFGMKIDRTKKAWLYRMASGTIRRGCPAFGVCTKNVRYGRIIEIGQ